MDRLDLTHIYTSGWIERFLLFCGGLQGLKGKEANNPDGLEELGLCTYFSLSIDSVLTLAFPSSTSSVAYSWDIQEPIERGYAYID